MNEEGCYGYFCHICHEEVSITFRNNERICDKCDQSFIEVLEEPRGQEGESFNDFMDEERLSDPNIVPTHNITQPTSPFMCPYSPFVQRNTNYQPAPFSLPQFNPSQFSQLINQLFSNGSPLNDLFRIFTNTHNNEDTELERILHQLFEQHAGDGPPPASKEAISKLARISGKQVNIEEECTVCKENFVNDDSVIALPCDHQFHDNCILPWLGKRNTCPVCRYQLPPQKEDESSERETASDKLEKTGKLESSDEEMDEDVSQWYL